MAPPVLSLDMAFRPLGPSGFGPDLEAATTELSPCGL